MVEVHGHEHWRHPGARRPMRPTRHQPPPWVLDAAHQHARRPVRSPGRRTLRAARRVPVPLLLIGGAGVLVVGVSAVMVLIGILVFVATTVLPIVLIAGGVKLAVSHSRRTALANGRGPAIGMPHGHVRHLQPPRPQLDPWPHARARFAQLRHEYAAYECDALAVLRLPALADVSVPSTARFVEAFAEAQALDADGPVPPDHRAKFVAAVEHAWRAWHAARDAAERIRTSHLPAEERAAVERVVRLLTIARETDNDAERLVAYGKARSELAKLERTGHVRIPQPAQAQLDNAYRGQLPG